MNQTQSGLAGIHSSRIESRGSDLTKFDAEAEQHLIQVAKDLRPLLAAAALTSPGRIADEVVAALTSHRLWSLAVPRRWGGWGVSATGVTRISCELAKGDPSVAWVAQIINTTTWVASLAPDEIQEDLFSASLPRVCGVVTPAGRAIPVDGGYRVSGEWPYSSGFRQADWGQWGVNIVNADASTIPGNLVYIPTADMELKQTWDVVGMQATGSDTAVATDVFVPAHRLVSPTKPLGHPDPGKRHFGEPSDYWLMLPYAHRTVLGLMIGIAEAMLEMLTAASQDKGIPYTQFTKLAESSVFHFQLGRIVSHVEAARALLARATGQIDDAALQSRQLTTEERSLSKALGAMCLENLGTATEMIMTLAGSSAFYASSPLQKYWRDFAIAARHVGNIPHVAYEILGKSRLGISPNISPPHLI